MLGYEDRMSAHRGLLAVIGRFSGREALRDEVAAMGQDRVEAATFQIGPFLRPQPEAAPEGRPSEPVENLIQRPHPDPAARSSRHKRVTLLSSFGRQLRLICNAVKAHGVMP